MNMMFRRVLMDEAGDVTDPAAGGGAADNGGKEGGTPPADNGGDNGGADDNGGTEGGKDAGGDDKPDDWNLNNTDPDDKHDNEGKEGEDPDKQEGADGKKSAEFALVLPEGYKPDEAELKSATAAAKQFGIDPKAMGLAMRAMDADAAAYHKQVTQEDADRLREDWGTNYEAYVKETRTFAKNLEESGLLPPHMKNALNSPEGVRFLHGLSSLMGEDKTMAGAAQAAVGNNDARDIMTNPDNPLHQRWLDNDPAVCLRVDRGLGLR